MRQVILKENQIFLATELLCINIVNTAKILFKIICR